MSAIGYHCEVVGSLLRPDYLKEAMERDERGEIDKEELNELQDRAATENIALQEECGIEVITDGETRRRFWFDPLTASLSGYDPTAPAPVPFHSQGKDDEPPPRLPAVTGKLGIAQNLPLKEYEFVRKHTDRGVKVTLAGMTYASVLWVPGISDEAYPDREDYMDEALGLMKQIVGEVVDAGADYVPARLAALHPPRERGGPGEPPQPRARHRDLARADDRARQPADQRLPGRHLGGAPLPRQPPFDVVGGGRLRRDRRAALQRSRLRPDPRRVRLAPRRHASSRCASCPRQGRRAGADHHQGAGARGPDQLKGRIEEASQHVPLERLGLSPQCGFASTLPGNRVTFDDQRAKLELLGRVAHEVWS